MKSHNYCIICCFSLLGCLYQISYLKIDFVENLDVTTFWWSWKSSNIWNLNKSAPLNFCKPPVCFCLTSLFLFKVANPNILSLDFRRRRQQQRCHRVCCRRFFSRQRHHWWPKSLSNSRWVIGRLKICVGDALGDVAQQISHRQSMKKCCQWILTVNLSNRKKILYQ